MDAINQTLNSSNLSRIEEILTKAEKRDIQPIDIVDVSELKIDISGTIGTIIDETISTENNAQNDENQDVDLKKVEQGINKYLKFAETDLEIEIDKDTNQPIIKIVRSDDKEVIKEIPPKEVLDLIKRIKEMVGTLCDCSV